MLLLRLRSTKGAVSDQCTGLPAEADGEWDGKNSGGNIEGLSTPENSPWWTQTAARRYRKDATVSHVFPADLYVH